MVFNDYGQQVGLPLPDWTPRAALEPTTLIGHYCSLVMLGPEHTDALFQAFSLAKDDRDWTWLGAQKPASRKAMSDWLGHMSTDRGLVAYAVIDSKGQNAVGAVCFANIDAVNGVAEIGHVTWSPLMQRSVMGTEAIFLMLSHAFSLGYRRVAWRCDSTNVASRSAAERVGFTFEGRFRQAMTRKQRNRDTDWLSVIDGEWPALNRALSAWLRSDNFTGDGKQKVKLRDFMPPRNPV